MQTITLSDLSKTWIFDVDGTLVKHNGHLEGKEELLSGVEDFFKNHIRKCDTVILLTSRDAIYINQLKLFLKENEIRFDYIICNLPHGERIMVNDKKPSGLETAFAINKIRDCDLNININIDNKL